MKLSEIKAELRKMLLQMSVIKTDNGVLQYDGEEYKEGTVVKKVNEDGTEEIPSGEFVTEDNKKLTIENGEIKTIEEIDVQPVEVVEPSEEEPTEEPVAEEEKIEEPVVEEPVVEEPVVEEEPTEEPAEETEPKAEEEVVDEVATLKEKIAELEGKLADALKKLEELAGNTDTILSKVEKMSLAKPIAEEMDAVKTPKKTGNSKLDKFLEGCK